MSEMLSADLEDLLEEVLNIALDADKAVMTVYQGEFDVEYKSDESPLTRADMAAHQIIKAGLESLDMQFPVLSEEDADIDWEIRRQWQTFWLVDPLDGTKDFINRSGEFTVNIALIHDNEPVLGVVSAPAVGQAYLAAKGVGAFRQDGQGNRQQIECSPLHQPPRILASKNHLNEGTRDFIDRLGDSELVQAGSSLKFCRIAEGAADIYPRLGPTCEWDTAAAQCVLEAAGGRVETVEGELLRYGKEEYLNPFFIAFSEAAAQTVNAL